MASLLGPGGEPILVGDIVAIGQGDAPPLMGHVAGLAGNLIQIELNHGAGQITAAPESLIWHIDPATGYQKRAPPQPPPLGTCLTLEEARAQMLHENSFTRLPWLLSRQWALTSADWLMLLGEFWSLCDNIGEHSEELVMESPLADLFERGVSGHIWMDEDELAAFDALPDEVTIWRGCYAANKWGLSWSLNRETAERFPTLHRYRQAGQPLLVKARVRKDDILALKLDRDEAEIIARRPKHVSTSYIRCA